MKSISVTHQQTSLQETAKRSIVSHPANLFNILEKTYPQNIKQKLNIHLVRKIFNKKQSIINDINRIKVNIRPLCENINYYNI